MPKKNNPGCNSNAKCGCNGTGSGNRCRCPGCELCKDNKSPREIIVTLDTVASIGDPPCNDDDCQTLAMDGDQPREYVFLASQRTHTCQWTCQTSFSLANSACADAVTAGGDITVTGDIQLNATDDPTIKTGTLTMQFAGIGTFVFTADFAVGEGELIDCNGVLDGPWLLDIEASTQTHCTVVSATIRVTKCTVPCCTPCACCGPVLGSGRKLTSISVTMPDRDVCGDVDCSQGDPAGSPTSCCPSLLRAYNGAIAGRALEIVISPFESQCADATYTEDFNYEAETGDPAFHGVFTPLPPDCWRCPAGTATFSVNVGVSIFSDTQCAITVRASFADYTIIMEDIIVDRPIGCQNEPYQGIVTAGGFSTGIDKQVTVVLHSRVCKNDPECGGTCFPQSTPINIWITINSTSHCPGLDADEYKLVRDHDCLFTDCRGCCWGYSGTYTAAGHTRNFRISLCIDTVDDEDDPTIKLPRYRLALETDTETITGTYIGLGANLADPNGLIDCVATIPTIPFEFDSNAITDCGNVTLLVAEVF